jgi:hypothetical protein
MTAEFYNEYYDLKNQVNQRIKDIVKERNGINNLDVLVRIHPINLDDVVLCRISSIKEDVGHYLGISSIIDENGESLEFGLNDMFLIDAIYLLDKIK